VPVNPAFENRLRRPGAGYLRHHADHCHPADRAVSRGQCLDHLHRVGSAQLEAAKAAGQQCSEQAESPQLVGDIAGHPATVLDFLGAGGEFRREVAKGCKQTRCLGCRLLIGGCVNALTCRLDAACSQRCLLENTAET
jgi:hypothetical protein